MRSDRIVFMGTSEISAVVLEALIDARWNVVGAIAQPDKPVGRKKILQPVPVKVIARQHNIPVFQPAKIRLDYEFLKELKPDVIITFAYGQIVPQGVLDIPTHGCINLHGSILPKYRGAAPIQYALRNGEKETGITLMQMIDKMDAGVMYDVKKVAINEDDNSTSLFKKMAIAAKELILEDLDKYLDGKLLGLAQDESLVTFCPTIKKPEEQIPESLSCEQFVNYVRSLADEPGAYVIINDLKVKIYKAKVLDMSLNGLAGQIVKADKSGLILQLKDGCVELLELQKEGKNRMDYKAFINGNNNIINAKVQFASQVKKED